MMVFNSNFSRPLRNDIQGPFMECMLPTKLLIECIYCTIVVEVNDNPECNRICAEKFRSEMHGPSLWNTHSRECC